MTYYKLILVLMLGSLTNVMLAGGGWPKPKGQGYFKLSQFSLRADQHYTDQGKLDPNVTIGVYNTTLYGEYGFTNRLTGIINAPLFARTTVDNVLSRTTDELIIPGDAINGIGDVDLSIKYGLNKPGSVVALSASLLFGLPFGADEGGRDNNLQLGDGEFNQMVTLDAGIGLGAGYMNFYAGYNNRTNNFSDEFRYGVEGGISVLEKKLWITGRIIGVESLENGSFERQSENFTIFANDTKYTTASIELNYYVTSKIGVSANYATAFRGELILASPAYTFGVFYDMK
jgi:hypothetical protein